MGALRLVTGPQQEPISLAEAKEHLGISGTAADFRIQNLIIATREWAENFTGRKLITQTWDWSIDEFPETGLDWLTVPFGKLQTLDAFTHIDGSGELQTLDASPAGYQLDTASDPGRVGALPGGQWPSLRGDLNGATLRIVVGYGLAAAVPRSIKTPMLLYLEALFDKDEKTMELYMSCAEKLLLPHRIYRVL